MINEEKKNRLLENLCFKAYFLDNSWLMNSQLEQIVDIDSYIEMTMFKNIIPSFMKAEEIIELCQENILKAFKECLEIKRTRLHLDNKNSL